ncbi:MAG: hypothetical protein H6737_08915 [Alphaproteobacteria bacterium]|nr:hypothetical protein [Alphaproteobacteria bacterium]
MDVQVLNKGRFEALPDATCRPAGSTNVWEIEVPVTAELQKRLRRGPSPEDWDDAVFLVNGVESEPAVGSGEGKGTVKVTVFFLQGTP